MLVERFGRGPQSFFCIHGWSGNRHSFEPLIPFMPKWASLYCVDLPGCGDSFAPAKWDLGTVAEEIGNTLRVISRGSPITVVGNCIGALLALRAGVDQPGLVSRFVLIDPLAYWPWYFRVFTASGWGRYAYSCTFANPIGRWITNASLHSKRSGSANLTEGFAEARSDVALNYLNLLREIRSAEDFAGIEAPVDILYGSRTFGAVRESTRRWKQVLPQARIWELHGAGHLPLLEAPRQLSEIVFEESHVVGNSGLDQRIHAHNR